MFDAKKLRKKKKKDDDKDLKRILNYHYNLIDNMIKEDIKKERLFYKVSNFIPGFRIYNNVLIAKLLVHKLVQQRYEIQVIDKVSFWILWDTSIAAHYKLYIDELIGSLRENILAATKDKKTSIFFIIPHTIDHDMNKIKKDITYYLKKKHFKVVTGQSAILEISW